jgi:cysteine synthase A
MLPSLGPTPLVPIRLDPGGPDVWCKLEYLLPSGSTKDRIARYVLDKAWRRGDLRAGATVVEASSGSTGIALALACAQFGLRFLAVLPEGVSEERLLIVRAYGGEVRLTPARGGICGALAEAERLARDAGMFWPRQFSNPDNAEAHRVGTAREVLDQLPGQRIDAVVSGVGTGGTLVGLHRGLCEGGCPAVPVLARPVDLRVTPEAECCSFSGRVPGVVDGLSEVFRAADLPDLLTVEVTGDEALTTARRLIRRGFPVGPSSGLNYAAAVEAARRVGAGACVVTVFPDRMERYFSTELFERPGHSSKSGL